MEHIGHDLSSAVHTQVIEANNKKLLQNDFGVSYIGKVLYTIMILRM